MMETSKKKRFYFTEAQLEELTKIYPNTSSAEIAARFGCGITSIYNVAHRLGLKKAPEFIRRTSAERIANPNHPARKHWIKKGTVSHNKGRRQSEYMTPEAIERTKATRFQKGARVWNHKPIGYERVNRDGYIDVKVAEPKTFKLKQRIVWEEHRGAIPRGHNIQFKDGNRQNCDIENLYLISRKDQIILNSGSVNLPDGQVATYLATASRKVDRSLRDELLKRPDLLEVKRQQLQLNRTLKNQQNERQNADS